MVYVCGWKLKKISTKGAWTTSTKYGNIFSEQEDGSMMCNFARYFRNWLCGTTDQPEKYISPEEKAEIRRKLTSLTHNAKWGKVLNVAAIALATMTAFLLGFFGWCNVILNHISMDFYTYFTPLLQFSIYFENTDIIFLFFF